jgi:hypothetical protein
MSSERVDCCRKADDARQCAAQVSEAGGLPWTHRAEVVADDDAQQEGQAPGPRIVHCLGSRGLTNSSPHARLPD